MRDGYMGRPPRPKTSRAVLHALDVAYGATIKRLPLDIRILPANAGEDSDCAGLLDYCPEGSTKAIVLSAGHLGLFDWIIFNLTGKPVLQWKLYHSDPTDWNRLPSSHPFRRLSSDNQATLHGFLVLARRSILILHNRGRMPHGRRIPTPLGK